MDVREKLTQILASDPDMLKNLNVSTIKLYRLVDKMIAHGVTLGKVPRAAPDLTGKCGSGIYAEQTDAFGKSEIYVQCRNPELEVRRRRPLSGVKARTTPACGRYVRQQTPQPRCIYQDDKMPGRRRCMATKDMEPCIGSGSCLVYKPEETK